MPFESSIIFIKAEKLVLQICLVGEAQVAGLNTKGHRLD